jgi:hypothetical protein
MCCCPTREALILGSGFRTVQGHYCFQRARNGFQDRCIMYYLFIYTLEYNIRRRTAPDTMTPRKPFRRRASFLASHLV